MATTCTAPTRTSSPGRSLERPGDGASPGAWPRRRSPLSHRGSPRVGGRSGSGDRQRCLPRRVVPRDPGACRSLVPSSKPCLRRRPVREGAARGPLPTGPPAGRPARRRSRGPGVLARARGLRSKPDPDRGRAAVGVLRRASHGQRDARRAPRRGPGVQGRVPSLPDDEGAPCAPEGRLGLPRAAGGAGRGEGARVHGQGRHRGLRGRRVQRPVPRLGGAARGRVRGDDRADGLLGRHVPGLPHHGRLLRGERLVVAEGDLRPGAARPGPPRRAVLSTLRDRAVRPRACPGLRDRRGPLGLCPDAADVRSLGRSGRPARVDDDPVDARVQHRGGRQPRGRLRGRVTRRRPVRGRCAPRRGRSRRGLDRRGDRLRALDGAMDLHPAL